MFKLLTMLCFAILGNRSLTRSLQSTQLKCFFVGTDTQTNKHNDIATHNLSDLGAGSVKYVMGVQQQDPNIALGNISDTRCKYNPG